MAVKNTAKVIIGGKIITLGGYESEEYFQKVGREQRTRSYQIRYECGYCGFSGILYLISPLPMHSLEASSYTTPNCPGAIPCNFSSETIR